MERYAQKEDKRGFFINMTKVWPILGLLDDYTRTFSGSKEPTRDRSATPKTFEMARPPHNSG